MRRLPRLEILIQTPLKASPNSRSPSCSDFVTVNLKAEKEQVFLNSEEAECIKSLLLLQGIFWLLLRSYYHNSIILAPARLQHFERKTGTGRRNIALEQQNSDPDYRRRMCLQQNSQLMTIKQGFYYFKVLNLLEKFSNT